MKRLILSYLFLFPAIGSFAWVVEPKHSYSPLQPITLAEVIQLTPWDIATVDFTLTPDEYLYVTKMDDKFLYCETGLANSNDRTRWHERKLYLRLNGTEPLRRYTVKYKDLIAERFNEEYFEQNW